MLKRGLTLQQHWNFEMQSTFNVISSFWYGVVKPEDNDKITA